MPPGSLGVNIWVETGEKGERTAAGGRVTKFQKPCLWLKRNLWSYHRQTDPGAASLGSLFWFFPISE